MSSASRVEVLTERLKRDIRLLEQLHVLAQTQSLFLESGDLPGMTSVVEAKEKVVSQLAEPQPAALSSLALNDQMGLPQLMILKERAFYLLNRISIVESGNERQLQEFRTNVIRQSQKLQEDRKLQTTYGR